MNALTWLRQRFCAHVCSTSKMQRRADGMIECPCERCGKVLVAHYGLALNARLVK